MKVGVVVFPGTNCEADVVEALRGLGGQAEQLWHGDPQLPPDIGAVILPGGFAHGDYLRTGAIARFSPIMGAVADLAAGGRPVLGICNGFQILCEAGLLPGALQKNARLKFLCTTTEIVVESSTTIATLATRRGDVLRLPINHFEGNYTCSDAVLDDLIAHDQIVFRYADNPNGSTGDIAGVCNRERNVVGLMPHPERASHELLGSIDGQGILASVLAAAVIGPARPATSRG
jgi:phosphoribosylformylglycinamidine synthase subunit PurQ / glutaminase